MKCLMKTNRIVQDLVTLTYYVQYRHWWFPFWRYVKDDYGRPQSYGLADSIDTINRRISKIKPPKECLICIKSI